jgi:hypothetical protein
MYSTLRSERPHARSSDRFFERTDPGSIVEQHKTTLFQTLWAAFTEICWPQIARASVWNGSPRGVM